MNDDYRTKYEPAQRLAELRRRGEDEPIPFADEEIEGEPVEILSPSFGIVSADRQRKLMVDLRFLNGNRKARAYAYLVGIDWDRSQKIVLDFSGSQVTIAGWNLEPLYDGLVTQRVAWIQEMEEFQAEANVPKQATVVTKIQVIELAIAPGEGATADAGRNAS